MNEEIDDSEDLIETMVSDGIMFLNSIINVYGNDRGLEIWDAMGDALGRKIKGKILFAMLSGGPGHQITLQASTAVDAGNAVPVIKCIRTYTGLGLKDAKDIWDMSKTRPAKFKIHDREYAVLCKRELRQLGCLVT